MRRDFAVGGRPIEFFRIEPPFEGAFPRIPQVVLHSMHVAFIETIKCFVADRDRLHKFRNFLLWSWDGPTGRMDKQEGV